MAPRAKYVGPYDEVVVTDPYTNQELDRVVRGGLLSSDVPAKFRDELLTTEDWTEVKDPSGSSKKES